MAETSTTTTAAALEQEWSPVMRLQCNEEERIASTFDTPDGVSRIGNQLNITKVLRIGATAIAAGATHKGLNYTANTELNVTVTPKLVYDAVEIDLQVESRMQRFPKYKAGLRKQMAAGIAAQKDADAAFYASQLSVTRGGAAAHIDQPLMLSAIGTLIKSVRDLYNPGANRWAFLTFHPDEYQYVQAIPNLVSAQIRGDSEKPIKVGWISEALGLALSESGSVYQAVNVNHNFLHIRESHVMAGNFPFRFQKEQEFELVTRLIGVEEYAFAEVWDEYGIDVQTQAA